MKDHQSRPDKIAELVLQAFDALPQKCKPRQATGVQQQEWVPLAGIVAEDVDSKPAQVQVVALATGMKCIPEVLLDRAKGCVLHDSHAEVLVLRALNRVLLQQCFHVVGGSACNSHPAESSLVLVEQASDDITAPQSRPFRIRPSIKLYMYCSECPCGDASMELVMSRQADPAPWQPPASASSLSGGPAHLLGRGHFDQLGVVRRKPSRPDAPIALSKSCSDKLALCQYTSLLSGICSIFIEPQNAYLHQLILSKSDYIGKAVERAFGTSGRMSEAALWPDQAGYSFRPFGISTTNLDFAFARQTEQLGRHERKPSNIACALFGEVTEVMINGVLQGRKQSDPRGASALSRRRMWELAIRLSDTMQDSTLSAVFDKDSYGEVKSHSSLEVREQAKSKALDKCLLGWTRNGKDTCWGLSEMDSTRQAMEKSTVD